MEKELVPYVQSLQLKELGFDETCFGKWLSSFQSGWKVYELILEMGMNEEFEDNRNVYLLDGACSAPTFSQAFRWFREENDLQASNIMFSNGKYDTGITRYKGTQSVWGNGPIYDTYEEAELACLIKLIELAKQQKM